MSGVGDMAVPCWVNHRASAIDAHSRDHHARFGSSLGATPSWTSPLTPKRADDRGTVTGFSSNPDHEVRGARRTETAQVSQCASPAGLNQVGSRSAVNGTCSLSPVTGDRARERAATQIARQHALMRSSR